MVEEGINDLEIENLALERSYVIKNPSKYTNADSNLPPIGERFSRGWITLERVPGYLDFIKFGLGGRKLKYSNRGSGLIFFPSFWGFLSSGILIDTRNDFIDLPHQEIGTKDPYQIRVNGVVHFGVVDSVKAALDEKNYLSRLGELSSGFLRRGVGSRSLLEVLSLKGNQDAIDFEQSDFDKMGVKVDNIQIKDIDIPDNLEREISRVALAELEKQTKIILAEGEFEAAKKLQEAAKMYQDNPAMVFLKYMAAQVQMAEGKGTFILGAGIPNIESLIEQFANKFKLNKI